jgi:nucleoside-diphosphate-sugar epimerase
MDLATTAPVLVTGGSGFVAGHLVNQLLQRGYKVRTSVRSKENSVYDHLLKLPNAEKNLEVVEADLTKQSTWEAAFAGGVEFVFHVASPHILKPEDPENTLILPAVGGTQNILEMCQRTESVKKLIFTSCMCAVSDDFDNNREYDESDWNTMSSLTRNSYAYSKALAEMGVVNFASRPDCRFKIATILPCIVLGPALTNRLSFSHKFLLSFLNKQIRGKRRCMYNPQRISMILICFVLLSCSHQ